MYDRHRFRVSRYIVNDENLLHFISIRIEKNKIASFCFLSQGFRTAKLGLVLQRHKKCAGLGF
jgi:hypothetical protein